ASIGLEAQPLLPIIAVRSSYRTSQIAFRNTGAPPTTRSTHQQRRAVRVTPCKPACRISGMTPPTGEPRLFVVDHTLHLDRGRQTVSAKFAISTAAQRIWCRPECGWNFARPDLQRREAI